MKKLYRYLALLLIPLAANAYYLQPPFPQTRGGTGTSSQSASKAVTTDPTGKIVSTSDTTATEIGYIHGLSGPINTVLGGYATQSLNNLNSTSINADLICATSGSCRLGSSMKPFGDSFLTQVKAAGGVVALDIGDRLLVNQDGQEVANFATNFFDAPLILSSNVYLTGSTAGSLLLKPAGTTSSYTITFPSSVGSVNSIPINDGTGQLSWGSAPAPSFSIGALDGEAANSNGLTYTGGSLYAQSASGSDPGLVNTTTQTMAGNKTFSSSVISPTVRMIGSSAGAVSLSVPSTTASYSLKFPSSAGTGFVYNDGLEQLHFTNPAFVNISGKASVGQVTRDTGILTESANATTIDWSRGNSFTLTLNGNLNTVNFTNVTLGQTIVVAVTNTASNYTVTWGNGIKWSGGSQPVQTVGDKVDVWTFINLGFGLYYGSVVQDFTP